MVNCYETMGERIRILRKMRGLSQEELAELIDVSIKHLSKIERDEVVFSVEILRKIAQYFDVSSDYILRGGNRRISKEEIIQWIEKYYDEKAISQSV